MGAMATVNLLSDPLNCFNPRPRDGGDPEPVVGGQGRQRVSIRAPVMGAMPMIFVAAADSSSFQSAPP